MTLRSTDDVADHFRRAGFSGTALVRSQKFAFGREGVRVLVPGDRVLIGSITKQFTAAAILKLVDQHRVRVTDSVSKYIPGFRYPQITIHQLLTHSSGISEMTATQDFEILKGRRFEKLDPLIDLIVRLPLTFEPGSKFDYSNSNYALLSKIIEVASGESWWSYLKRELILPAGMTDTEFLTERGSHIVSGHTFDRDYSLVPIASEAYYERGWAHGAGGLESTVQDLQRWNEALYGGRLLSSASLQAMTTKQIDTREGNWYGYGIFVTDESYFHPGGIRGFIASNAYYSKTGMSSIVLGNYESAGEPVHFGNALAEVELKGQTDLAELVDMAVGDARYAGRFLSDTFEQIEITMAGDHLVITEDDDEQPKRRLVVRGEGWFFNRASGDELRFAGADTFKMRGKTYRRLSRL